MARRLMWLLVLWLSASPAFAQVTAIRAGRLVEPSTGTVTLKPIVLVEDDTIRAIGPDVAIPQGATVIDLSALTILPGMFDAHTHLTLTMRAERDGGRYYFTTLLDPDSYRAIQGVANARTMLEAGSSTPSPFPTRH